MADSYSMGSASSLPAALFDAMPTVTMPSSSRSRPSGDNITVAQSTGVTSQKTLEGVQSRAQWELLNYKVFSETSIDFLIKLFIDEFPLSLRIQSSKFLDKASPSSEPLDAPKKFVAPVQHTADQGHWTLVYVTHEREDRNHPKPYIRAQHYDPNFSEVRYTVVKKKLVPWVERYYGKDIEMKFEKTTGPEHDERYMSGLFIIMAAREFAKFGTIKSTSKMWDGDPRRFIKDVLQGKRDIPRTSRFATREPSSSLQDDKLNRQAKVERSTAPSTPCLTPTNKKRDDKSVPLPTFKRDIFTPAPRSQDGKRRCASPSTLALAQAVTSKVNGSPSRVSSDSRSEPNSKRRRIESDDPFNVSEKLDEIESFASRLGFPTVASLKQECDKRIVELGDKKKAFEKKNQALDLVIRKYAQHTKEHTSVAQECENLDTQISTQEMKMSDYISKLPPVSEDMGLTVNDLAITLTAKFQAVTTPLKDKLKGKLDRKRKASEMLESAGRERTARQVEVEEAKKEKGVTEDETRQACQREVIATIMEDAFKKLEVERKSWNGEDWLDTYLERRGRG